MKFHKEGYPTLLVISAFSILIHAVPYLFFPEFKILHFMTLALGLFLLITVLQFFRSPSRIIQKSETGILAPCDGKVVAIEEVEESEYFHDRRIQLSIFMSPLNVHVNRYPIGGKVEYVKYHAGLYLVAWHPKSSTENERSTIVVQHKNGKAVLFRQIAGALARRIVFYAKEGALAEQGEECGFIKFGSRVDIFLPIGTKIKVKIGDKTTGGATILGEF